MQSRMRLATGPYGPCYPTLVENVTLAYTLRRARQKQKCNQRKGGGGIRKQEEARNILHVGLAGRYEGTRSILQKPQVQNKTKPR